jgi:hypothetical protein
MGNHLAQFAPVSVGRKMEGIRIRPKLFLRNTESAQGLRGVPGMRR